MIVKKTGASVLVGAVIGGIFAFGASAASACACGAVAPPPGAIYAVGQEEAIVSFDGTTERIDMVLGLLSEGADGTDAGLVVPTPTPATVSLGDFSLFEAIERQIEPEVTQQFDWWSFEVFLAGAGVDGGGAAPTVLSRVDLGPVEAVTLAADDADGLREWLDAEGYGLADEVMALLDDYVERGWSFAALKLTGEEPLDGEMDPIRFEFETEEPVYPLLLSQAAQDAQNLRLYIFGDTQLRPAFRDGAEYPAEIAWAGTVEEPELRELGDYLTVVAAYFGSPTTQITADLDIAEAAGAPDVQPVVVETIYLAVLGIPLGYVLVLIGAVGVVLAIVLILRAKRGSA